MSPQKSVASKDDLHLDVSNLKPKRFGQVIFLALLSVLVAASVASGTTQIILLGGGVVFTLSAFLAFRRRVKAAIYLLLWSATFMLAGLAVASGGIRDMALLGFPCALVFAILLGNVRQFFALLGFMLLFTSVLTYLTVTNQYHPFIPETTAVHFAFITIILLVTAGSVHLMYKDQRRLLKTLQDENDKVKQSQARIEQLAYEDTLTKLPNRRCCEKLLEEKLTHLTDDLKLFLFYIDIDGFKPVNDALGHALGDEILVNMAQRIQHCTSPHDVVARIGGDEFVVLLLSSNQANQVPVLADCILKEISAPLLIANTCIHLKASVGIACLPDHGNNFTQLYKAADLALGSIRGHGGGSFRMYDESLQEHSVDKFNLLLEMREALEKSRYSLYYQPKIELATGRILGAEALIRWHKSDQETIAPVAFIPLAESSGFIVQLGEWVLRQACMTCAKWRQLFDSNLRVAVNVSAIQFRDGSLEQKIVSALGDAGLPPEALEIELTESTLVVDSDDVQAQLNSLSELGISFSIDDFGTGYSNLGYLRKFNASHLKIDKSFVQSLKLSERDRPLVMAIIQMSKSMGLKTVAEGIEDISTAQILHQMGCDEGQGFYWSKPVPEDVFAEMLLAQHSEQCDKPAS